MKKTALILWIVAALFLVSSVPLFTEGNIAAGACGIAIAAVLFLVGYRKKKGGAASGGDTEAAAPLSDEKTYKVYVEKGGEKYHHKKECSGMKNPQYIPLKDALKKGYTECKKCSR